MKRIRNFKIVILFLLLFCANTIFSEEAEEPVKKKKSRNSLIMLRLSDWDVILTLSSIEWGTPDRWSITSRYIHEMEKERNGKTWLHNLGLFLSPGVSGGRLGVDYLVIYTPDSWGDFALLGDLRAVLLRTWGNPLSTSSDATFAGAEFKICLSFLLNVSAGYYSPIENTNENISPFWGFHLGVGI